MEHIYADVSTCDTVLICLPIENPDFHNPDLGEFFKKIMFGTQFDQTENCDHIAKIINYLNGCPVFSLLDFKKVLDDIKNEQCIPSTVMQAKQGIVTESTPLQQRQPVAMATSPVNSIIAEKRTAALATGKTSINDASSFHGQQQQQAQASQPKAQNQSMEKGMSWFYLMQHYNKENAAAYKAQKEAKKRAAAATKGKAPVQQTSPKKTMQASQVNAAASRSMNNPGFAIPGQPAPAPTQAPASNLAGQNRPATSQPGPAAFPRQAAPQQAYPQQEMPRQAAPQQAMPRQAAPQQAVPRQAVSQQAYPQQAYPQQAMPRQAAPQPAYTSRPIPQGQTANFGETTVLGGAANGETTVLNMANNPAQMIAPHLIRKKSNEKISINKPVFRVGKERSYVDYFIGDNTAISRSHANFITRDGEYFVVDTNSTNHTFVNGRMIQSNVETKISHGDTVRLANEDFAFRMY